MFCILAMLIFFFFLLLIITKCIFLFIIAGIFNITRIWIVFLRLLLFYGKIWRLIICVFYIINILLNWVRINFFVYWLRLSKMFVIDCCVKVVLQYWGLLLILLSFLYGFIIVYVFWVFNLIFHDFW